MVRKVSNRPNRHGKKEFDGPTLVRYKCPSCQKDRLWRPKEYEIPEGDKCAACVAKQQRQERRELIQRMKQVSKSLGD